MKTINLIHILAAIFILITISGCASMFKKSFIKPKITYEAMKIDRLELTGATIRLYLGIDNKNNMDFILSDMTHTVSLEKNKVLETSLKDKVFIKGKEKTIVEFPLELSFLGVKDNIKHIWQKQKIEYMVESIFTLETVFGKIPLKYKFEDFINLPPLPELKFENLKVDKMGFSEMKMIFFVRVMNNDKIQLDLNELTYEIRFNDFEIAKGAMDSVKASKEKNDLLLEIPVNMQLLSLKKSITDMLKKGEINYDINLHLNVNSTYGGYVLPLEKKGTTKIY